MKTIKYISRIVAIVAVAIAFAVPANAQMSDNGYANIDWNFNVPLDGYFADKASGWGMNFEGGYFVTSNLGIGAFIAYSSNHKYIPAQKIPVSATGTLYTDQQHTVFQLPFGVGVRYQFNRGGAFQPYVAGKIGPQYTKYSTNFNVFEDHQNTWGFYMSPEIGVNVFPWSYGPGLHVAIYYSYATNKVDKIFNYDDKGLGNFGFRVGVAF